MRGFFSNQHDGIDQTEYEENVRQRYGGTNTGAAFFGWLVSNSVMVLILALLSALGASIALWSNTNPADLTKTAGALGLFGSLTLLATLFVAYYAGGYVAGRMSRFNGTRQGFGVWVVGIFMTVALAVVGAALGANYNLLQQLNLPAIPVADNTLVSGGLATLLAGLIVSLLAAMTGGKVGAHYHHKIDKVGHGHHMPHTRHHFARG